MTIEAASDEVERRIGIIETVIAEAPPQRLTLLEHDLEIELEDCRLELNALLYRAEAVATQLRQKYQMLAAGMNQSVMDADG